MNTSAAIVDPLLRRAFGRLKAWLSDFATNRHE
jgi:hypothetical protein